MQCVSSCQYLTSLTLSIYPRMSFCCKTIFPKSLNLPALKMLDLSNFTFYGGKNRYDEPFSAFTELKSLIIRGCKVRDTQIINMSSETLSILLGIIVHLKLPKLSYPLQAFFAICRDILLQNHYRELKTIRKSGTENSELPIQENILNCISILFLMAISALR